MEKEGFNLLSLHGRIPLFLFGHPTAVSLIAFSILVTTAVPNLSTYFPTISVSYHYFLITSVQGFFSVYVAGLFANPLQICCGSPPATDCIPPSLSAFSRYVHGGP